MLGFNLFSVGRFFSLAGETFIRGSIVWCLLCWRLMSDAAGMGEPADWESGMPLRGRGAFELDLQRLRSKSPGRKVRNKDPGKGIGPCKGIGSRSGERHESVSRSVLSDSATPWTVACQALLSVKFSRREYWSR